MKSSLIPLALFESVRATSPKRKEMAWDRLRMLLLAHEERAEKDGRLWSPVSYRSGARRGLAGVEWVTALVLDFDTGARPEDLTATWERLEYVVHSTFGHTEEHPKWRAVFPLAEMVPAEEWPLHYRQMAETLGQGHADLACSDASRIYFTPSCPPGAPRFAWGHEGQWLEPSAYKEEPPRRGRSTRLRRPEGGESRVSSERLVRDALERSYEGRNLAGFWLACQLRDNGYSSREAENAMRDYAARVPGVSGSGKAETYSKAEALHSLEEAYSRPAREPWETSRRLAELDRTAPPPEREQFITAEAADDLPDLPEALLEGEDVPPLPEQLAQELDELGDKPSELTLARRWARENKQRFAFFEGSQWWEYSGGRWRYSSTEHAEAEVQRYMERVRFNGVDLSIVAAKVTGVLKLARPHLGVHKVSELNAKPTLIPLANGVYDTETGSLLPHSPAYFLTTQLPFGYEPGADCPRWKQFLREVMLTTQGEPCAEWIDALQEWFGYCLVADNTAQVSMVWVGEGRNGKGVAARCLEALLGSPSCCAVPVEQLHDPYHRAELQGKLVGFVNEPDPKSMLRNGAYFKAITGGDTISARRPTEKVFSFVPFCRLVISTNSIPGTKDLSAGYFRRLLILEWRRNFGPEDADPQLDVKLREELPGIFNWAVEGLRRFRDRGGKFAELPESDRLLAAYKLGEDPLRQFIEDECEIGPEMWTWFSEFYAGYRLWSQESGYGQVGTKHAVAERMNKLGYTMRLGRQGDRVGRYRQHIRIRPGSDYHPDQITARNEKKQGKLL